MKKLVVVAALALSSGCSTLWYTVQYPHRASAYGHLAGSHVHD